MNRINYIAVWALFLIWSFNAFTLDINAITSELSHSLEQGLKIDGKNYRGQWQGKKQWEGFLCDGYSYYNVNVAGSVEDVRADVLDNGSIDLQVLLSHNEAGFHGFYRSKITLCKQIKAMAWMENLYFRAHIRLQFLDEGLKADIHVLETIFHGLDFKKWWIPDWLEKHLTTLLNKAARYVWSSFIGRWIEKKLAHIVEDSLGKQAGPITMRVYP